jgi:DNA-binding MarR family transcriptional regulator
LRNKEAKIMENSTIPTDELFTTSVRITIMLLLFNHKRISFTELQKLLQLTSGNLDHHIKKLESANYVKTYKKFTSSKRPLTTVEITSHGKTVFEKYIKNLKNVLNAIVLSTDTSD